MANYYGGSLGNSKLTGSKNNDSLFGYGDDNLLKGLAGDDDLDVSSDDDALDNTLVGGGGKDTLEVSVQSVGPVTVSGNTLSGGGARDIVDINIIQSDGGADVFSNTLNGGGGGDDLEIDVQSTADATVRKNTFLGGDGDGVDALSVNVQSDGVADVYSNTLKGLGGNDTLNVSAQSVGNALIHANKLVGGGGKDRLDIAAQSDTTADVYSNTLNGGAGSDVLGIDVQGGVDAKVHGNSFVGGGGTGKDKLSISVQSDATAEVYSNTLKGGEGNDTVDVDITSTGDATVNGNNLAGEAGVDSLSINVQSGAGADVFSNTLSGGGGADTLELIAGGTSGGLTGNTLNGGKGADKMIVQTVDSQTVQEVLDLNVFKGAGGSDTLNVLNGGVINGPGGVTNIEVLDVRNGESNTVSLNASEVKAMTDVDNRLRLLTEAGDTVDLSDWTYKKAIAGGYKLYTSNVPGGGKAFLETKVSPPPPVQSSFNLSALDGSDGFVLYGVDSSDLSGKSVSSAGDINGDGFDDLIIGANKADGVGNGASETGEAYVVFGKAGGWGASLNLSGLNGSNGFVLYGKDAEDWGGRFVSSAGDVNGDGFDDLLISAFLADGAGNGAEQSGESYVVFGKASGWSSSLNLSALNGSDGFVMYGVDEYDWSGISVSRAGDVNGDGFEDFLIGASAGYGAGNATAFAGETYVVFGKAVGWTASMNLSALDGSDGFVLNGVGWGDQSGFSTSSAGDVNGDGFDDIFIGAAQADLLNNEDIYGATKNIAGESYVVFGKASGWSSSLDLSALDGSNGFTLHGVDDGDQSGKSVANAGDINGDGFDDLIIGANHADGVGNGLLESGDSYVVFGKASGWSASVELSALNGSNGFTLYGKDADDRVGLAVSSAGDVNGDGFDDLLIAALGGAGPDNAAIYTGETYVVFGKAGAWSASMNLGDLDGSDGFVIYGVDADDQTWPSFSSFDTVSSVGDVNGDGFDDLIIGAKYGDGAGNGTDNSGESYVFFGRDFTNQIDASGSAGADYLVGSALDDTIAGLGGADAISGGAGDDILGVSDLTFSRVDGGNGEDTLRLDGSNLDLDLTSVPDTRLQDLEVIDLNGNSNTLTLTKLEVLNLSTHSNTLRVMGSGVNSVTFSGFSAAGTTVIDTVTYDVYTSGEATLQLQQGLTLNISPVAIDLNGDGVIDYQGLEADGVQFDADGDGQAESVAWVGPNDGFLVFDANGDHLVTDRSELALSDHAEGARTDLEGLAMAFDTDGNGSFDANDDDWSRFGIWQDKNQDGITDEGEFYTMEEAGIEAIDLALVDAVSGINAPLTQSHPADGVTVFGETTVQFTDGTEGLAADVGLGFQHAEESESDLTLAGVLDDPLNEGSEEDQALVAGVEALRSDDEGDEVFAEGEVELADTPADEIVIPETVTQEDPLLDSTEEELLIA